MKKKLISIITPVYNEEENINWYYTEITKVTDRLSDKYNFEFIITDNHSSDNTFRFLEDIATFDKRVRVFRFSRNFGYQKSIWTGYSKAKGDAAIEFDCDLQDSPELLPQFLEYWEEGYKIVYGVRVKREEGVFATYLRKSFYRVINLLSEHDLPQDAGDFMLIDAAILSHLRNLYDNNLYLRGIIFSLGYDKIGIKYSRGSRLKGKSKFPLRKQFGLAIDGIVSQSTVPLRLASFVGFVTAFLSVLLSGFFIILKLFFNLEIPAGFTTTAVLILLAASLNAIFLGIIGEYIARIYSQVKQRPMIIIEKQIDNL